MNEEQTVRIAVTVSQINALVALLGFSRFYVQGTWNGSYWIGPCPFNRTPLLMGDFIRKKFDFR